jgi:hypothetical protein
VAHHLARVGQREQVVQVAPANSRPAQMIRDPRRLDPARERFQLMQIIAANRIGGADRHRDAMHYHRVARANAVEDFERAPTSDHEIFRKNLEPVHRRIIFEDVDIVIAAQSNPKSEKWKVLALHRITRSDSIKPELAPL